MVKKIVDDNFVMSPKIDFVFKLLFGDDKNKDLLIAFLSAVLKLPEGEFAGIEILNTELFREFKEDKKGILDVRAKTVSGNQIDIEIQVLPTEFMPERTLFYWSKMYTAQVKPGDTYDQLKKCITINIVDFKCTPLRKLHTSYHLMEDETRHKLTDILEVHFLEIPKLLDDDIDINEDDPIVQWMEFLDGKSKGVMEMLAKKNESIKKAYNLLQIISKDEKARIIYEAREAELRDQLTRIKSAEEKGANKKALKIAEKMIKRGDSIKDIIELTELSEKKILELKNTLIN
ncbi:Rpn family recombination-promoting nuclease/putative transposase [Clostridium oryzae]|uniref:PD-(D/E)XK nuclease family transposase n=1 Tax=Clostridium oryzae TaxID=1450648 RepID=A0A1V4IBY3_9CLOT|nr:Rpn family recombination-promoting nuclease/putative transposase [Clostridium oryzae]OPJ57456.1 PD-(D/E)XK nuclease family transposase [Clostridium oryzae]